MEFKFESNFEANVIFESNIAIGGWTYLVIYGRHINGYYCCIPNWKWGCEMAEASQVSYNKNKLIQCGVNEEVAEALAKAIEYKVSGMNITTLL